MFEDRFELTGFHQLRHTLVEQFHQAAGRRGLGKAQVQRQFGNMRAAELGRILRPTEHPIDFS
ncbi:hypothetical protein D3C75_1342190 [compost metagenome]